MNFFQACRLCGAAASIVFLAAGSFAASPESSADKERRLIAILQSEAPPQDKAIPCKQLAVYGSKDAVPALAPLLANSDLASWARIALEAIPGPEADRALRDAVRKLSGTLLIGTMNSIGVRRDPQAVATLANAMKGASPEVLTAAAVALGRIGGNEAAKVLRDALASSDMPTLAAVAEGAIRCGERFMEDGQFAEATRMYDAVRQVEVPRLRWLEATRGAILARRTDGLPMLLQYLRSPTRAEYAMALRTARELKGREVTEAIGAELEQVDRAGSERGVMLLLALADRTDDAVLPRLLRAAQQGSKPTRVAAVGLFDRFRDPAVVPVLLTAASDADQELAAPAKATLSRMEGKAVDTALLDQLPAASGRTRQAILELAALRRIDAALPAVMKSIGDTDPDVRRAALSTLGLLGSEAQAGDLAARLSQSAKPDERESLEAALTAICGRTGAKCVPLVLPLARHSDSDVRKAALHVLAATGGSDALGAVQSALSDRDEEVQDEAVGTLATWPNNWPDDAAVAAPLLNLIKSDSKRAHQVQGARGYLLHVQENRKLTSADKLQAVEQLLPLLKQPPEKRLAVAALGNIASGRTLQVLTPLAADADVAEEACLALVNVATTKGLEGATPDARRQALQTAAAKSHSEATQRKASDALKTLK